MTKSWLRVYVETQTAILKAILKTKPLDIYIN